MILTFSGACGIEDGDSLIVTGGSGIEAEQVATKTVDRYNSKVRTFLFKFLYDTLLVTIFE